MKKLGAGMILLGALIIGVSVGNKDKEHRIGSAVWEVVRDSLPSWTTLTSWLPVGDATEPKKVEAAHDSPPPAAVRLLNMVASPDPPDPRLLKKAGYRGYHHGNGHNGGYRDYDRYPPYYDPDAKYRYGNGNGYYVPYARPREYYPRERYAGGYGYPGYGNGYRPCYRPDLDDDDDDDGFNLNLNLRKRTDDRRPVEQRHPIKAVLAKN